MTLKEHGKHGETGNILIKVYVWGLIGRARTKRGGERSNYSKKKRKVVMRHYHPVAEAIQRIKKNCW